MPKKATSAAQWKFLKAMAAGKKPKKGHGPSPAKAKEMLEGQPTPEGLPPRAKRKPVLPKRRRR